jgi:hypothetical protein
VLGTNINALALALLLTGGGVLACTGGTTGDFSGDLVDCEHTSEVSLGDGSELGFTPESVLAFSEGEYVTRMRWFSPCEHPESPCGRARCRNSRVPQSDGTETTLRVAVERTGEKAIVKHGPTQCAELMRVPVMVTFITDDGLLDERFATTLWTETGRDSGTGAMGLTQELNGALRSDGAFDDETYFDFGLSFYSGAVEVDLYFVDPAEGVPLLVDHLPPYDSCNTFIEMPE